mgnify:CR=1 FL=1
MNERIRYCIEFYHFISLKKFFFLILHPVFFLVEFYRVIYRKNFTVIQRYTCVVAIEWPPQKNHFPVTSFFLFLFILVIYLCGPFFSNANSWANLGLCCVCVCVCVCLVNDNFLDIFCFVLESNLFFLFITNSDVVVVIFFSPIKERELPSFFS